MKYITTILTIICAILILSVVYLYSYNNELQADLTHLNKNINTIVKERSNDKAKAISDTMRVQYHRLNTQLIDSLINKENEKTIDSLRSLDTDGREQYLFTIEKRFGIR